jgi:hypothetical protein
MKTFSRLLILSLLFTFFCIAPSWASHNNHQHWKTAVDFYTGNGYIATTTELALIEQGQAFTRNPSIIEFNTGVDGYNMALGFEIQHPSGFGLEVDYIDFPSIKVNMNNHPIQAVIPGIHEQNSTIEGRGYNLIVNAFYHKDISSKTYLQFMAGLANRTIISSASINGLIPSSIISKTGSIQSSDITYDLGLTLGYHLNDHFSLETKWIYLPSYDYSSYNTHIDTVKALNLVLIGLHLQI